MKKKLKDKRTRQNLSEDETKDDKEVLYYNTSTVIHKRKTM
jgi:hypothetical protein